MKRFLLILIFGFYGSTVFAGKVISFYPRLVQENYDDMILRNYNRFELPRFLEDTKRKFAHPTNDNLFEVLQRASFLFNNDSYFVSGNNSISEYEFRQDIYVAGTALIFDVAEKIKNPSEELVLKMFSTLSLGYLQTAQLNVDLDRVTNVLQHMVESNIVLSLRQNSKFTPTKILNLLLNQGENLSESSTFANIVAGKPYKSRLVINEQTAIYLATWAMEDGEIHNYESLKDFQTLLSQAMDIGRGGAETRALSTALQTDAHAVRNILSKIETVEEFSDFFYTLTAQVQMNEDLDGFQIRLNALREGVLRGFITSASYLANSLSRIAWDERPRVQSSDITEFGYNTTTGKYEKVEPLSVAQVEKIYLRNRDLAIAVRREFFAKFQSFPNWKNHLKTYAEGSGLTFLSLLKLKATPTWMLPSIQEPDWSQSSGSNATTTLNEAFIILRELGAYHTKPYLYESPNIPMLVCESVFK